MDKKQSVNYPSKSVESSILKEKETGQDISEEGVTSTFIESVIKDDKIVGWIKFIVK